ncbi:Zn-ribbon domain-containing OB-fold protein [Azospirillum doebereinerae]
MMPFASEFWSRGPNDGLFWDYCLARELRFQTCRSCGVARQPPHPICPVCASADHHWVPAPATSRLYSFTVVRTAAHPAFKDDLPYIVAIVEFPELPGIKMVTRLFDADAGSLRIGVPLTLVWEPVSADLVLPCFRPGGPATG